MAPETRNERIAVRVPASVKAKVMRAAEMEGRSTSDLLIEYMRRATDEIFARNRHIALANADWDVFTDALAKPPEPGSALTHAATVIARALRRLTSLHHCQIPLQRPLQRVVHCNWEVCEMATAQHDYPDIASNNRAFAERVACTR